MRSIIFGELRFFITSIFWGVILIVLYDIFRILRRVIKHSNFVVMLEDISYWSVNAILVFRMIFQYNNGVIRTYTIIGVFVGMILYFNTFSDLVVNYISSFINGTLDLIVKVIRKIIWIIEWPFRFIFKKVKKVGGMLLKKVSTFVKKNLRKLVLPHINRLNNAKKRFKIKISHDKKKKAMESEEVDPQ